MMKNTPVLASLLLLTVAVSSGFAAGKRVDNVKIAVNLLGSPEIVAQIKPITPAQPKRPRPLAPGEPLPTWLEFEVDFDTAEEFPELQLKYSIILKSGQTFKLAEGEVTHVDVGRGKDRHSVMYIGPKSLNKISEGKQFTPQNISACWVDILAGGEVVGGFFKPFQGVTLDAVTKLKDKLDKIPDTLLNKSQTPFSPLFYDYYEAVKPSAR
jgi:hypothetical protein